MQEQRTAEPLDFVLSLVSASEEDMTALVGLIRPGRVIVTTANAAEADAERDARALSLFVRSDADQLAALVDKVDAGELRVDVTASYPLSKLAHVHEQGAAGRFRGKVIVTPA